MRRILLLLLALFPLAGLLAPTAAHAVLITVNFSVLTPANDALQPNQTLHGSFSFDSSLIPSGGGNVTSSSGLGLASFDLTVAGNTWSGPTGGTAYHADAWAFSFDSSGNLTGFSIGGAPNGYTSISPTQPDIFIAETVATHAFEYYGQMGSNQFGILSGEVSSFSTSTSPSVPEPGTVSLLGLGLLPLGMIRRRKQS